MQTSCNIITENGDVLYKMLSPLEAKPEPNSITPCDTWSTLC
jgi:hypothetical protein